MSVFLQLPVPKTNDLDIPLPPAAMEVLSQRTSPNWPGVPDILAIMCQPLCVQGSWENWECMDVPNMVPVFHGWDASRPQGQNTYESVTCLKKCHSLKKPGMGLECQQDLRRRPHWTRTVARKDMSLVLGSNISISGQQWLHRLSLRAFPNKWSTGPNAWIQSWGRILSQRHRGLLCREGLPRPVFKFKPCPSHWQQTDEVGAIAQFPPPGQLSSPPTTFKAFLLVSHMGLPFMELVLCFVLEIG